MYTENNYSFRCFLFGFLFFDFYLVKCLHACVCFLYIYIYIYIYIRLYTQVEYALYVGEKEMFLLV